MTQDHVIMVASQYPPVYGGAGQQAQLLATRLVRSGLRVTVATLDQQSARSKIEHGVSVRRYLRGVKPDSPFTRALTTVLLGINASLIVLIYRPTAVHIHGAYWWSILPAIAGRLTGSRVVLKVTRDGEDDPNTVFDRRVRGIPVGSVYGLSFRLATDVIFLSDQSYKRGRSRGLVSKARRVNNGVDSEVYYRSEARKVDSRKIFNVPQERAIVLFVGYLVRHKGVIDLLDAWDVVRVSADAELWLVGPYGDFYRELDRQTEERIRISHLDSSKSIRVFGALPNNELPLIYGAADVFVLPSYREGMPNSMAEAMMSGCSIVGTRIPGIVDLVSSSQDTKLVDPGDVAALAEALVLALTSPTRSTPEELQAIDIDSVAVTYRDIYRGASQ